MPANYVLLEKITVGAAGASSVTFSGIPQTGYTDLKVVASTRGDRSASNAEFFVKFNGATTNFTYRLLQGNATAAASNNGSTGLAGVSDAATNTANTFANSEIYIPNYTSANYKSYSIDSVEENNTTSSPALYTYLIAGLWSNTAAITSIELYPEGSTNWTQYSTFYLYGVAKLGTTPAISPYATGGDTIMTDGTYWYHTFLSSGTFTPQKALSCDYLVVAGGGGGAQGNANTGGGGGGAGGYRTSIGGSPLSLGTSAYTVTIGAGGAGGSTTSQQGPSGSTSTFSTISSSGGAGGVNQGSARAAGGSGGGGENFTGGGLGTAGNSGGYSPVEGYAGGAGGTSGRYPGGGGGGSSVVGGNGTSNTGGAGGNGTANSISGSSVTYAGGGGGGQGYQPGLGGAAGAGGTGGGGAGSANSTTATSGTANLGGGGGGGCGEGGNSSNGGAGGSGIVIVRYAV
jgi:hypothetical protein